MPLALAVALTVFGMLAVLGVVGWLIDRSAERLEAGSESDRPET
jgi:hypothetical protein